MPHSGDGQQSGSRVARVLVAILVGLLGSMIIWAATPYNNLLVVAGFISDSYLPIAALFLVLVLLLVVNPLLMRLRRSLAFDRRQMALIMGMLLMASVIPGQGLLRMLPYSVAKTGWNLTQSQRLSQAWDAAGSPDALFPNGTNYGDDSEVSYDFLQELGPDEPIPWAAWLSPLVSWGGLILAIFLMMVGLSMIVLPQWQRNERLAFPLLELERSLIAPPEPGHHWGPLFRKRSFWIATGIVFVLLTLHGLNKYFPQTVPAVPLDWDLDKLFTEEPLLYLPLPIKKAQIFFLLVGVAFFMPSRIGFSVWFFQLAYSVYAMVRQAYIPPYHHGTVQEHRTGAMIALTVGVLWLGRQQWGRVARSLVQRRGSDDERYRRAAGFMFLLGAVGIFAWLLWVNVQPWAAALFVVIAFMVGLLISRLVAETGVPFLRIDSGYAANFIKLLPVGWVGGATAFFSGVMGVLMQFASRVNPAAMSTHALALDPDASPRDRTRLAWLFIALMVVGIVFCGAVHLYMSYHHSANMIGDSPLNSGSTTMFQGSAEDMLKRWDNGKFNTPPYSAPAHIAFGAALAGALQWASLTLPKWPLHPVGILIAFTFYGNTMWASIFFGWALKGLILRFGGAGLYRSAIPFFMGLIVGEIAGTALWSIVPGVLGLLGMDVQQVLVQPL